MAAISALSTSLYSSIPHRGVVPRSFRPIPRLLSLSLYPLPSPPRRRSLFLLPSKPVPASWRSLKAVAEGEAAASEEEQAAETVAAAATTAEEEEDATVAVPVSPSDMLTMFFQVPLFQSLFSVCALKIRFFCGCFIWFRCADLKAEGTMDESAISGVSKAFEGQEGISDLNVRVAEGIATVETLFAVALAKEEILGTEVAALMRR
ncbi:hypothetical protein BHE74_00056294 [Ensete ventricosum]|nr:hypothetical protein BHE74_00056294 [Ensete ventricosum]